jgi:hypothetical protein
MGGRGRFLRKESLRCSCTELMPSPAPNPRLNSDDRRSREAEMAMLEMQRRRNEEDRMMLQEQAQQHHMHAQMVEERAFSVVSGS